MPARDDLVQIHSDVLAATRIHTGIVSPCSACKNQRASNDGAKPFCPRRYWTDFAAQGGEANRYLLHSGTDSTDKIANPVYIESENCVLLWVATLENNQPRVDTEGKQVVGSLLDPDYDTDWMHCELYPYVCEDQASLYQNGAYKEGSQLLLFSFPTYQVSPMGERQVFAGVARKINFPQYFSFQTPDEDLIASGT
jgi:hypothetical protein